MSLLLIVLHFACTAMAATNTSDELFAVIAVSKANDHTFTTSDGKDDSQQLLDKYGSLNALQYTQNNAIGSIIVCSNDTDSLCQTKIGPQNSWNDEEIIQYFPISVNIDLNLSHIITIYSDDFMTGDYIKVYAYFYAVYENHESKDVVKAIQNQIFSNASSYPGSTTSSFTTLIDSVSWGIVEAQYDTVQRFNNDMGHVSKWSDLYNNYYWQAVYGNNMIIYLYGLAVECSNQQVYEELINDEGNGGDSGFNTTSINNGDTTDSKGNDGDMIGLIVGIVVGVLALIVCIGMIYYVKRQRDGKDEPLLDTEYGKL